MDYKETLHMPNTGFEMRGNLAVKEPGILEEWENDDHYQKILDKNKDQKPFVLHDGPPYANGNLHAGTAMNRTIKDIIVRSKAMSGYYTPFFPGWDTHGLPVELEVEKKLGLDGKDQIEAYGMEPFIKECKESVWKYKGMWEDFSSTVGFWADMENPYVTYDDNFI